MNSTQWQLYNLLKSDSDKWWTTEEICNAIPTIHYVNDSRNPSPELTQMRLDINSDTIVDKIIVTKKHCYKIATYEEYKEERNYHIRRLKAQVKQIMDMDFKFNRNGQGKLFNSILEELKPTNEQSYETFVERSEEPKVEKYTQMELFDRGLR